MKSKNNEQIYTKLLAIIFVTSFLRTLGLVIWATTTSLLYCSSINSYEYIGWIILYFGICVFSGITLFLFVTKVITIILTNKDYPFPKKTKVKFMIFPFFQSFQLLYNYTRYKKWTWEEYCKERRAEWEEQQKNQLSSNNSSNQNTSNTIVVQNNKEDEPINLKRLQYWFQNVSIILINKIHEVYRIGIETDKNAFLKDYIVAIVRTDIQDPRTILQQVYNPFLAFPSVDFQCIYSLKPNQHRPIFSFKYYHNWVHNNYYHTYFKTFNGMVRWIRRHFKQYNKPGVHYFGAH